MTSTISTVPTGTITTTVHAPIDEEELLTHLDSIWDEFLASKNDGERRRYINTILRPDPKPDGVYPTLLQGGSMPTHLVLITKDSMTRHVYSFKDSLKQKFCDKEIKSGIIPNPSTGKFEGSGQLSRYSAYASYVTWQVPWRRELIDRAKKSKELQTRLSEEAQTPSISQSNGVAQLSTSPGSNGSEAGAYAIDGKVEDTWSVVSGDKSFQLPPDMSRTDERTRAAEEAGDTATTYGGCTQLTKDGAGLGAPGWRSGGYEHGLQSLKGTKDEGIESLIDPDQESRE